MPLSAGSVHPSYLTWMGVAREAITAEAVMPSGTLALEASSYDIEDTPKFLPDTAIRGSMVNIFNEILGPQDATFSLGGPAYLDIEGYLFDNMFGDLSTTGTTAGSVTTLSAAASIGGTSVTVASISGFASGNSVQIDTGSVAEVVILDGTPSGSVLTFGNTPLRFPHNSGGTVQVVTGPYVHRFAALNSGSGQPPTHTLTDYTGVTPTTGARQYVSACTAQLDLTGNAEQLLMWKVTGSAWTSAAATATPVVSNSFVVPIANWRGSVNIGGTVVDNVGEWAISFKRKLQIYWTAEGTNNPYFIARGPLDCTGTVNYTVAAGNDESPLTNMLNNIQPSVDVSISNGQAGTAALVLDLHVNQAAFIKSKPVRNAELFAYQDEFQAVANATDIGGSGGLGPGTLTLTNNVATY